MTTVGEDPGLDEEESKPDPITLKPDLYEAAKSNDTDKVNNLLGDGVPPTYVEKSSGWTPLHWAAIHGNIVMIKNLLEKGASEPYHRMTGKGPRPKFLLADSQQKADGKKDDGGGATEAAETTIPVHIPIGLEDDDEESEERKLETSVNLTKNTPLLWAAFKGHLRAVWFFLVDSYSPNDVDNMGNNSLHLSAVNGHMKILKTLIDDGANANAVNFYKNKPIDMAMNKEIREALADAMVKGASFTSTDVAVRHDQNMKLYQRLTLNLSRALDEAKAIEGNRTAVHSMNIPDIIRKLADALRDAREFSLDEVLIVRGDQLMQKLETTQDILADVLKLQQMSPIRLQGDYIEYVHKLERSLERGESIGLDGTQLQFSRDLIKKCNIEFWVETMCSKVRDVPCARDEHEHDMNCLKKAIQKAQALRASDEVIEAASALYKRLDGELSMSRALNAIPAVRIPIENPPEGYWQDCDTGKITETPEYPLPPEDGNYVWEPAEAYTGLYTALERLKEIFNGAEDRGVNPALCAEVKGKLFLSEKELKLLEAKDAADKQLAIDNATKLAKKLKKGKKGGGKKK